MSTLACPRLATVAALSLATVVCAFGTVKNKGLSSRDVSAIRAVLERYRTSWLANDAEGIRGTFTPDVVLMPHHGVAPVVGIAAINQFWWPANASKTKIVKFVETVDEVDGSGSLAYLRGRSEVAWKVGDPPKSESWHNSGNFLAILKKRADGKWLISHLIWDDPPNQRGLLLNSETKWLDPSVPYEIDTGSGPFVPLLDNTPRPK